MAPKIYDDFATDEEVDDMLGIFTNNTLHKEAQRCLECNKPYKKYLEFDHEIYNNWAQRISDIVKLDVQLSYKTLSIMVNSCIPYHVDNSAPDEGSFVLGEPSNSNNYGLNCVDNIKWVPNHCPNRLFTSVIYLTNSSINDKHDGATVFPQHDICVSPVTKRLLVFSCDISNIHGVMNAGNNIRVAALMWFSKVN